MGMNIDYGFSKSRPALLGMIVELVEAFLQMIPMRVSGADQQEIMRLLCRVHQLEIENLESQSASLLRDFQIKKKDMVISRFRQHRNLIDDIIRRQRDLMDGEYSDSLFIFL